MEKPKYIRVIEGKFEGWTGYLTGKKTTVGNPIATLYDGKGKEARNVMINESEFEPIRKFETLLK